MFNKRDSSNDEEAPVRPSEPPRRPAAPANHQAAVIGPSINVDGKLRGDEDLLIEGRVKGTVELKKNSVTIGASGKVEADIFAHTIFVDGTMDGNLVASERVVIRKTAQVRGSISAPSVSLEDGARFNGSIDMDPETEALKKAFSGKSSGGRPSAPEQAQAGSKTPELKVQGQ